MPRSTAARHAARLPDRATEYPEALRLRHIAILAASRVLPDLAAHKVPKPATGLVRPFTRGLADCIFGR